MKIGLKWIDEHSGELIDLAQAIWGYAEPPLKEIRSAQAQAAYLEGQGFRTRLGMAGMPSALVAEFGQGKPVIGFLGEYDALPGLSQKVSPRQEPVVAGGPGHGCGHNLLGVGCVASAVALKREIEAGRLSGTVRYYGCPAEETLVGKVFMAKAGAFDDLDVALTWHPSWSNSVMKASCLAMNSARFAFHGRTAHAAESPHMGISALDAVELMNMGANYLREHVPQEARIHYVTLDGGHEPNVVPAYAESWYYVRAPRRADVESIYRRLLKIAEGAALMTDARLVVTFLTGAYEVLPNSVISDLLEDGLSRVGPPKFTADEWAFAHEIERSFMPGQKTEMLRSGFVPPKLYDVTLHEDIAPAFDAGRILAGSTDVGDVSWIAPTSTLLAATKVAGTAAHSWQETATSGMGIGHKGMLVAAKAMAVAGYRLLTEPELIRKARQDFVRDTAGKPYVSPLPEGLTEPAGADSPHRAHG